MTGKTRPDTHAGQLRWRAGWGFLATEESPRRSERVGRAEMSVTGQPTNSRFSPGNRGAPAKLSVIEGMPRGGEDGVGGARRPHHVGAQPRWSSLPQPS